MRKEMYTDSVEFIILVNKELEDELVKKLTDETKSKAELERL
ncbi:MAG TPA: hypothetical protein PK669_13085 [Methanosarcina thermophila]|nr:hypothetical protein [Methanosarcina thermophila]HPZ21244.1 hypothetical protein [Methanosarcina thermophila]HQD95605.1 hypothetical protein [Methanosarcina thermophila]